MVGTIDQTCNILNVAEDAYDAASGLCDGQGEFKTNQILMICKDIYFKKTWLENVFFAAEYLDHPRLRASALDTSDLNPKTQVGEERLVYKMLTVDIFNIIQY